MSVTRSGLAAGRRSRRAAERWAAFERVADADGLVVAPVGAMLREVEAVGGWYARQLQEARDRQAVGRGRRLRRGR